MEATPSKVNLIDKKPDNSIELKLKSDKNLNYDISIYYIEDRLYFTGITKDKFPNKKYVKQFSLEEVKINNKFFFLHESIKEVYNELDTLIKNYKDNNQIKLIEETNILIIIFPLNTMKIKECKFEINELVLSNEQRFDTVFTKLKEIQDKFLEENNLLKNEVNKLTEKCNELTEQNKELKEQISKKDKIQTGEYIAQFLEGSYATYMYSSTGDRSFKKHISFDEKYEKKPHVMVSIRGIDLCKDFNSRLYANAENIDTSGFDLIIGTWADSLVFKVYISWISFG